MNKFLTNRGEMPVWLGDIDFMNEAVRDSLIGLAKAITGQDDPTCIISGCEVSSTGVTAGLVMLSGEILPVEASTIVSPSYHLEINSTYSGDRTFKDGTVHSAYETRVAVVKSGATVLLDKYILLQMPRIIDLIPRSKTLVDTGSIKIIQQGSALLIDGYVDITVSPPVGEQGYTQAFTFEPLPMKSLPDTSYIRTTLCINTRDGSMMTANIQLGAGLLALRISFTAHSIVEPGQYRFSTVVV